MLSKQDTKRLVMEAIAAQLRDGSGESWDALRATFSGVATTTFYRYVALVKQHGVPVLNPKQRANERQAKRKARSKPPALAIENGEVTSGAAQKVTHAEVLPLRPVDSTRLGLNEVMGFGLFDVARKLDACITTAEKVMATCNTKEGITNPDLLLRASTHLRQSVETSAKLMEMVWDIRRTEAFHYAIFTRLKGRDPELVKLILEDMRAVSVEMGMVV